MNHLFRVLAGAAALSLFTAALPALAAPQPQEHHDQNGGNGYNNGNRQNNDHPDYSNNSYYALGNREGYQDHNRKHQRKNHNHKYGSSQDRAAHDYGYQQGWSGQRGYNSNGYNNSGADNGANHNSERPH